MSTSTIIVIAVIVFAFVIAFVVDKPKRPKPQSPPGDVSDRSRFQAIKKNWEDKQ